MTRRCSAALFCVLLLFATFGCDSKSQDAQSTTGSSSPAAPTGLKELKKTDAKVGTGAEVKTGDLVFVTYTGKLKNGIVFDSNDKPTGSPLSFTVGNRGVIQGWEIGVIGMKVGGERSLDIPSGLAYGSQPPPGSTIPANSDLYFKIKLLAVIKPGEEDFFDKKDLRVGTGPAAAMGKTVTVHYKASLVNGRRIDSTYERKKPATFTMGKKEVIVGLEAGIVGMKVGGKRWLRIPPSIGYGSYGMNDVPPNNIVDFEVELLSVK